MRLAHPSATDPHYAWFHCPGCDGKHAVSTNPAGGWKWNGDSDKPTLSPSVLVRGTKPMTDEEHAAAMRGEGCPTPVPTVCHSFVTDGRIQFLGDCTHALAGQTVDLPELKP